jgi:hypothetical protein
LERAGALESGRVDLSPARSNADDRLLEKWRKRLLCKEVALSDAAPELAVLERAGAL